MWSWFKKKEEEAEPASIWKSDFSDCVTADFLPAYSVCQSEGNRNCRHLVYYSGMALCGHKEHKSFIPEGAEAFDPHKNQFKN